jgi:hypothetical protein
MSKQILQTYIESSFFSSDSSSLASGFVDVLLFPGAGVKEYCVDDRLSVESLVEADSAKGSVVCEVDVDILNGSFKRRKINKESY